VDFLILPSTLLGWRRGPSLEVSATEQIWETLIHEFSHAARAAIHIDSEVQELRTAGWSRTPGDIFRDGGLAEMI
jgi:hypothetical protein